MSALGILRPGEMRFLTFLVFLAGLIGLDQGDWRAALREATGRIFLRRRFLRGGVRRRFPGGYSPWLAIARSCCRSMFGPVGGTCQPDEGPVPARVRESRCRPSHGTKCRPEQPR